MSLRDIADCLKGGMSADAPAEEIRAFFQACKAAATELSLTPWIDVGLSELQAAMLIRSAVIQHIAKIVSVATIGTNRGYLLPTPPFRLLEQINATRRLFQPLGLEFTVELDTLRAAAALAQIAVGYEAGTITFTRKPAAQLSSYETSVDGISSQSGDPLVDILGYQPDGDFIKRKRAIDSLAKLDFTKRKPYLLFAMETDHGTAVCWSKMHDASGYKVSRRDVFYAEDLEPIELSNDALSRTTAELMQTDGFFQALSFYDWLDPQDAVAFVDPDPTDDTLYLYKVAGIQRKAPASPFIFDVPYNSLFLSPQLAAQVTADLQAEAARFGVNVDAMNPYPALAQAIYGDRSLGWIVAGCNVLASSRRGDAPDVTRSLGFVGASSARVLAEAQAGRLVVPSPVDSVLQNADSSIESFGVSQTILAVLDGTGVTQFVSGKDSPGGIRATQESVERSTSGLAKILSCIDPETASLDPKLISTFAATGGQVRMIAFYQLDDLTSTDVIDLTTHEGIGQFMNLTRVLYDFFPGAFI